MNKERTRELLRLKYRHSNNEKHTETRNKGKIYGTKDHRRGGKIIGPQGDIDITRYTGGNMEKR